MPGYHEHCDDDIDHTDDVPEDEHMSESAVRHDPGPDVLLGGESVGKSAEGESKPPSSKDPDGDIQMQTCPICSKAMQIDNRGMNAHIDFCLSKGAIREAQAMASTSAPKSKVSADTSRRRKKFKR